MINYAVPVLKVNFIFLFVYNNKKKTLLKFPTPNKEGGK